MKEFNEYSPAEDINHTSPEEGNNSIENPEREPNITESSEQVSSMLNSSELFPGTSTRTTLKEEFSRLMLSGAEKIGNKHLYAIMACALVSGGCVIKIQPGGPTANEYRGAVVDFFQTTIHELNNQGQLVGPHTTASGSFSRSISGGAVVTPGGANVSVQESSGGYEYRQKDISTIKPNNHHR